jgi:Protease subunit of ATP-dependent Clp proteases
MKKWFEIKNKAEGEPLEVLIHDEIGRWNYRAVDFINAVKAADDGVSQIVIGINSYGGEVFDGLAIYNFLRRLGDRVTARIDGIAASIASVIAVGAYKVVMPKNAMMFIHNPWGVAIGNSEDLRKTAETFDKITDSIVSCYTAKAPNIDEDGLRDMLNEETWLSAEEAQMHGLADEIIDAVSISASVEAIEAMSRLKGFPGIEVRAELPDSEASDPADELEDPEESEDEDTTTSLCDLATICASIGDTDLIKDAVEGKEPSRKTIDGITARIRAIAEMCTLARLPDLASQYARTDLTIEDIRARLLDQIKVCEQIDGKTPVLDESEETAPVCDEGVKTSKGIVPKEVYAKRKKQSKGEK